MGTEIVVVERGLNEAMPLLANVLKATPQLPAVAFRDGFLHALAQDRDKGGKLMSCSLQSLLNCASTSACLGLPAHPSVSQFFMLPFNGVASPCVGYKGYNTLGGRSGYSINADVVREGDDFKWRKGTNPVLDHQIIGPKNDSRRITHAWAIASALDRPPIMEVLDIEELVGLRNRSASYKYGSDSPYKDDKGAQFGLVAMFQKAPRRRLARSMPFGLFVMADAMEGKVDQGETAYILPNLNSGTVELVDGRGEPMKIAPPPSQDELAARTEPQIFRAIIRAGEAAQEFANIIEWKAAMLKVTDLCRTKAQLESFRVANAPLMAEVSATAGDAAREVSDAISRRLAIIK